MTEAMTFETWETVTRNICGPLSAYPKKQIPFSGEINLRRVADINMLDHQGALESLHWDRRHIAEVRTGYCYVVLQLSHGRSFISQNDNDVLLTTGDWTIIDSLRPAQFRFEGPFHILVLNLPRDLVTAQLQNNDLPVAAFLSGSTGASALFSNFTRSLYEHAPSLHPDDIRYRQNVLDLLFSSLPQQLKKRNITRNDRLKRAINFIEDNLSNSDLRPQMIAEEVYLSARHLSRLFEELDCSVADWIRQRRLERIKCDLADPRFNNNSILDIAYNWGFNDSSHFSRAFRTAFGQSPREYRRLTQG